eukprot:1144270-Pelagomonas_calceolata.AAC.6
MSTVLIGLNSHVHDGVRGPQAIALRVVLGGPSDVVLDLFQELPIALQHFAIVGVSLHDLGVHHLHGQAQQRVCAL